MSGIEKAQAPVDPFAAMEGSNPREEIEFVNSRCITCGATGEWVHVTKDKEGRITQYTDFDHRHYAETGGRKGKGHKKFFHFTLKRNHAEVFII